MVRQFLVSIKDRSSASLIATHGMGGYGILIGMLEVLFDNNGNFNTGDESALDRLCLKFRVKKQTVMDVLDFVSKEYDGVISVSGTLVSSDLVNSILEKKRLISASKRKGAIAKHSKNKTQSNVLAPPVINPVVNHIAIDDSFDLFADPEPDKKPEKVDSKKLKWDEFIDKFNEVRNRKLSDIGVKSVGTKGDPKAKRQFEDIVKKGFSIDDFISVVEKAFSDETHVQNNFKYVTPEFVTRSHIFERYRISSLPDSKQKPSHKRQVVI